MQKTIANVLKQDSFSKENIVQLLKSTGEEQEVLFSEALKVKLKHVGNCVYLRALIELSNICQKDCLYCGIRAGNKNVSRYDISDEEILHAAKFAYNRHYGSIALQAGERVDKQFTVRIENLLKRITKLSNNELGITISFGEQTKDTYQRWFDAGAHRYLLRIESSNKGLYQQIHPNNSNHSYDARLNCLQNLQDIGYQTGTGIMIGLPFQTYDDLANDLLLLKDFDVDMVGMGPFIEHRETPMYKYKKQLKSLHERFTLSLKMIAILRILMKDINIAAATALQAIDPFGREKAIKVGANVIMPNITPTQNRASYQLYQNKPCIDESASESANKIEEKITTQGSEIAYGKRGDSKHYFRRMND